MSAVATAIVGGAVVGAYASNRAAGQQADAANRASDISNEQYKQNREDMAPWREAGKGALSQLVTGTAPGGDLNRDFTLADFSKDPGYQFRMDEGSSAMERGAAARGGLMNGGTLKALARYNQDFASGEYGKAYDRFNADRTSRFNRLSSLAGTGQTAAIQTANMGTQNAQTVGNNVMAVGNARASGYMGTANVVGSGLNTLGNWWQQKNEGSKYKFPMSSEVGVTNTPDYMITG